MDAATEVYAVMATPDPVPAIVDRSEWPVHVTLAGNFRVDESAASGLSSALVTSLRSVAAFSVTLGPVDGFGGDGSVPVLLAEHPLFHRMHAALASELAGLANFAPREPQYWDDGYRPHATLGTAVSAEAGDELAIRSVTLVALRGARGRRVFAVDLQ